jgi:hypothetical protein
MGNPFPGYNQFICWKASPKLNGKIDKIPCHPGTGKAINPMAPLNWMAYETASLSRFNLGFVFTRNDPFFFVDVDAALTTTGWTPYATEVARMLPGCYMELSYSGNGFHIFGTGTPLFPNHATKNNAFGLELYTQDRFVALTGTGASGSAMRDGQPGLDWLLRTYFPERAVLDDVEWTDAPVPEWTGPEDDEELIKKALRSKSASGMFGNTASFKELYHADVKSLSKHYPDKERDFDHSGADFALCLHLAFYTGKNCERIERLFSASALGQRDKWKEREYYRRRTVSRAVASCGAVYNVAPPPDPVGTADVTEAEGLRVAGAFMDLNAQLDHFLGCTYVISKHSIFTPRYGMLKPDRFRAAYGGYNFAVAWEGKPSKSAFETFTESQLYSFPKADDICFRPAEKAGAVLNEEDRKLVNVYVPLTPRRKKGDAAPFLDLLKKMVPHETDREILLTYMAACVQCIGTKFQWAPLIQGVEGNGKTFLATAISKALGERYSYFPETSDLMGNGLKFSGWMFGRLFIAIEEMYSKGNLDLQERLKTRITNTRVEYQYKGQDQFVSDNWANFMLFSNYKDAVLKTPTDRRYSIFFTAQQTVEDLENSGMGGQYFPKLYDWARDENGYEIIADYLLSYKMSEQYNPATVCQRAPATSSLNEARGLARGEAEQEIREAIREGRPGFRGGWVSSVALDRLLKEKNCRLARNKRADALKNMGYHHKERMNGTSPLDDGKKPVLYATSENLKLAQGLDSAMGYLAAQRGP